MSDLRYAVKLRTLAEVVRAEREVHEITLARLTAWTDYFFAVMDLGGGANQLNVKRAQDSWDNTHAPAILAVVMRNWKRKYKKKRKTGYEVSEAAYATLVRELLSQVPHTAIKYAQLGQMDRIRPSVAATSYRVGRTVGPDAVQDGYMSSYIDTENSSGPMFRKSWVALTDNRVRHTHSEADADPINQGIPLRGKFLVGGFLVDRPRDFDLPAKEAVNCRCFALVTEG